MIGLKVKTYRKSKGFTLDELGKRAGITASYLSQVERNLAEPSISTLRNIAKAMNVPVYRFLIEDDEEDKFIIRKNERKRSKIMKNQAIYEFITPMSKDNSNLALVGISAVIPPGVSDESTHNAEEMILVIKGVLEITVEEDTYVLNTGDSIYLKANLYHTIKNIGESNLEVISCISPAIY